MSEPTTETVVVRNALDAQKLIGRSIGDEVIDHWVIGSGGATARAVGGEWLASTVYGDPHGVVVDALPPVTEKVHLDDLPGRTLPSGSVVECIEYHGHMSEQATETVVVDDANTARALIGRSIWGVQITDQMGDDGSFALLSDDTPLATGTYGDPHGVEVDALPPVTEWVHLDDLPGRTLPSGSVVECIEYHGHMGDHARWRWSNEHVGNSARFIPLTIVDHMVEVLAETPPPPEPDTVSVRDAAKALLKALDGVTFTPASLDREMDGLRAALAAEGDER